MKATLKIAGHNSPARETQGRSGSPTRTSIASWSENDRAPV